MREIQNYVGKAFEGVPDSDRKFEMIDEISARLSDSAAKHIANGKEREDAINKAIVDFGNMDELLVGLREDGSGKPRKGRSAFLFSIWASVILIVMVVFINLYYSPDTIWFVYPAFAILWWPLAMFFFGNWRKGNS